MNLDSLITLLTNIQTLTKHRLIDDASRASGQAAPQAGQRQGPRPPQPGPGPVQGPAMPAVPSGPPMSLIDGLDMLFSIWKDLPSIILNGRKVEFTDLDREMMPKVIAFCRSFQRLKGMNNPTVSTASGRRGLVDVLAEKEVLGDMTPIAVDEPIAVQTTPSCGVPMI